MKNTQLEFRRFWGGVAGWPHQAPGTSAVRYLLALDGQHVPDFAEAPDGRVYFVTRRAVEPLTSQVL